MPENDLLYEQRGRVAIATFNRPEVLNAVRQATETRLLEILDAAARDDSVRALILTGSGRAFSAGIDLKEAGAGGLGAGDAESRKRLERTQEITRRIVSHPKIIIAAVNGPAVGIGAEISTAADLRIAAESASFSFPEVKRALFLTNGVTYLLPRLVGSSRAALWLLTGEPVSAAEACACGFVSHMVPAQELLDFTLQLANSIAAHAPLSVRLVKEALRRTHDADLESMLELEVEGVLKCLKSDDFAEGIEAFLGKRAPQYRGC